MLYFFGERGSFWMVVLGYSIKQNNDLSIDDTLLYLFVTLSKA